MIFWITISLILWILCVLCMTLFFKGAKIIRGYEKEAYFQKLVNTQNIENSTKKEMKKTTKSKKESMLSNDMLLTNKLPTPVICTTSHQ